MATFKIQSKGTPQWEVEAATYRLDDGFFHFFSHAGSQLFAVDAESVRTIRSSEADQN